YALLPLMKSMLFAFCLCLVHTAIKEEARHRTASDLVYRPWRSGDVMYTTPLTRVRWGRRFVAVDPNAPDERNVVGCVEAREESLPAECIRSALSEKERPARVMYISHVEVREDWQNKTVGTTMLRQALKD
ncbi:hypothetical protein FOZ63_029452, partial [Perkinsus olseni]